MGWEDLKNSFVKAQSSSSRSNIRKILDEPTYLGFKILFHFNDQMSPLLNTNSNIEHSAMSFLKKNNYKEQEFYLINFINELKEVSQNSEWYFQGLEGLDSIWNFNINTEKIRVDKKIDINTLEGLDLRMTKIMDYYYRACFDTNNRREIIPENLRYFAMSIYITDIREFENKHFDENGNEFSNATVDFENRDIRPSIFFRIEMCEIDKLTRANILSNVSNNSFEQSVQKLSIFYTGNVIEYADYVLEKEIQSNSNQNTFSDIESSKPQSVVNPTINNNESLLANSKNNTLSQQVNAFNIQNNQNPINPNALSNLLNNQIQNGINRLSSLANEGINTLQNIINQSITPAPLILGNVYTNGNEIQTLRNLLNNNLSLNRFI